MEKVVAKLNPQVVSFINTLISDFGVDLAIALITLVNTGNFTMSAVTAIFTATARIYVKKGTNKLLEWLKTRKSES